MPPPQDGRQVAINIEWDGDDDEIEEPEVPKEVVYTPGMQTWGELHDTKQGYPGPDKYQIK